MVLNTVLHVVIEGGISPARTAEVIIQDKQHNGQI